MQTCPGCGQESPDRSRFCRYCGSVLVALAPSVEVRKTVTVVSCNLEGWTELAGRLDSEALLELLKLYFTASGWRPRCRAVPWCRSQPDR